MKILLAKMRAVYYSKYRKEFKISRSCSIFLIFSLLLITFQSSAFADLKEKSSEEFRLKGYDAQQKGNLQEALSYYVKASSLGSVDPGLFNDMGVVYEQLGLPEKAEDGYLKALDIDAHYVPAYSNLAYFYRNQGDTEKAVEYFKKRIEWGDAADPWTKKAKQELATFGKKDPRIKKWLTHFEASELNQEIVKKSQKEFYDRLIDAEECFQKGKKLAGEKKYEEAIAEYDRALALTPKNPKMVDARNQARIDLAKEKVKKHADLAIQMLNSGDTISAKVEIRNLLAIIPDEPIIISNPSTK